MVDLDRKKEEDDEADDDYDEDYSDEDDGKQELPCFHLLVCLLTLLLQL